MYGLCWHNVLFMNDNFIIININNNNTDNVMYTCVFNRFDVWLGNVRGNKYSCRHRRYRPSDEKFWDFCLDDIAAHDVPASVNVCCL